MIYFAGRMEIGDVTECRELITDFGILITPARWTNPHCLYACDNGVYSAWEKGRYWDETMHCDYLTMLSRLPADNPPLWVLLPDAVADWARTLEMARIYLPLLRGRGLRVALALQDGCLFAEAAEIEPDVVFVAGSTDWKLANIAPVCAFFRPLGIGVHVGRVNTARRLRWCQQAGAESADGTTLNKFRDKNLPRIARTLMQGCLVMEAGER